MIKEIGAELVYDICLGIDKLEYVEVPNEMEYD